MIVTDLQQPFIPVGSGLPRSQAKETGKLHVSDIIRYIMYLLDIAPYADWELNIAAEIGFCWEEVLEDAYAKRYIPEAVRLDELELDNIIGSPDGFGEHPLDPNRGCDHEYKVTWKSIRHPLEDNFYYMTQFKAYCKMIGTDATLLRILYLFGDWKERKGPQAPGPYLFTYTQQEIDENWEMILNHAKKMRAEDIWCYDDVLKRGGK